MFVAIKLKYRKTPRENFISPDLACLGTTKKCCLVQNDRFMSTSWCETITYTTDKIQSSKVAVHNSLST